MVANNSTIRTFVISFLQQCHQSNKKLVSEWLAEYMLQGQNKAKSKAAIISRYLAGDHLSHSRLIDIAILKKKGVKIKYTSELTPDLSDAILDIHYAFR